MSVNGEGGKAHRAVDRDAPKNETTCEQYLPVSRLSIAH